MKYVILPFFAWCLAGTIKFIINYYRYGMGAKKLIGYGGFPSTHTTILSSCVWLLGFENGFYNSIFSVALGGLIILVIDAHGLRRKVGQQAIVLNILQEKFMLDNEINLREKIGHTWFEIFGGLILGLMIAFLFTKYSF